MVYADTSVRAIAAELWVERVAQQSIDSALLGVQLLSLFQHQPFPLSRLTKQITDNMMNRSMLNNKALKALLIPMMEHLKEHLATGGKPLCKFFDRL